MSGQFDYTRAAPPASETLNSDIALAFARLVTHGNGGTFRLTRAAACEMGPVKITRHLDAATGDTVFTVETSE